MRNIYHLLTSTISALCLCAPARQSHAKNSVDQHTCFSTFRSSTTLLSTSFNSFVLRSSRISRAIRSVANPSCNFPMWSLSSCIRYSMPNSTTHLEFCIFWHLAPLKLLIQHSKLCLYCIFSRLYMRWFVLMLSIQFSHPLALIAGYWASLPIVWFGVYLGNLPLKEVN